MKFSVRMAESAEADLRDLFDYLSFQASADRANAYVERIVEFVARLECFHTAARFATNCRRVYGSLASNDACQSLL